MENIQNFSNVYNYIVSSESFQVPSDTLSTPLCSEPIVMLSSLINRLVYWLIIWPPNYSGCYVPTALKFRNSAFLHTHTHTHTFYIYIYIYIYIWDVVLEKDGKDQLDRSCEEWSILRVKEQRNILHEIRKRKAHWIGHILRRNCLLQRVIEGKIKGGIEVTGRRGRKRRKLLDD